jgi:hypothetical protein
MLENLRFYSIFLTLISSIIGILFWYKLPNLKSKLFLFSLFFSIAVDFVGTNFTKWTGLLNYEVYNLYILILFTYYLIFLKSLLKKIVYQNIASLFLFIFLIGYVINILFIQNLFKNVVTNGYAIGVLFVTILSLLYIFEVFTSQLILNYSKSIFFWFILGVLIFHVPFLPFMLSLQWFLIDYNPTIYGLIIFFLNLLMNCCFVIGFIWSEKKYNY